MTTTDFLFRLACALLCGAAIGIERQWRQRTAGLRTYTLVATGSALFVMVAVLTPGEASPTRVAAQVVTGIGFLGAGVIMRSGVNVRGLNTAATIWCSSAVGTLAGSGYFLPATGGTGAVLLINLLLRPLVALINRQPLDLSEQEFRYALHLTCRGREEGKLRSLLVQLVGLSPLTLHELESAVGTNDNHAVLNAVLSAAERQDPQLEQIANRLSVERNVVGLSWQLLPASRTD